MTEAAEAKTAPAPPASAGALLRKAREAQGLHIAALAASLKVPPKRLEALEADRWNELPDPAFTRALAQSVCRALKRDPAPVLALLPRADGSRLDQVAGGINTPFRDRSAAAEPAAARAAGRPAVWFVVLLLLAALAVWLWPTGVGDELPAGTPQESPSGFGAPQPLALPGAAGGDAAPAPAASEPASEAAPEAAAAPAADGTAGTTAEPAAQPASSAAPAVESAAAAGGAAAPGEPLLSLRARGESWVEVSEASGRTLLSRTLQAGDAVAVAGTPPLRLTIGNAGATEVELRGRPVDLGPHRRGNIARLTLD